MGYCGDGPSPPFLDDNGAVSACWRGAVFDGPALGALLLLAVASAYMAKSAPSVTIPLTWSAAPGLGLQHGGVNWCDLIRLALLLGLAAAAVVQLEVQQDDSLAYELVGALALRALPLCLSAALIWSEARRAALEAWTVTLFLALSTAAAGLHLWCSILDKDAGAEAWWSGIAAANAAAAVAVLCFSRPRATLRRVALAKHRAERTGGGGGGGGRTSAIKGAMQQVSVEGGSRPLLDAAGWGGDNEEDEADAAELRAVFGEDDPFPPRSIEQDSGLLSMITFQWFNPLIVMGYNRPLGEKDFFGMRDDDDSQIITERFERAWDEIFAERAAKAKADAAVSAVTDGYTTLSEEATRSEAAEGGDEDDDQGILSAILWALYRSGVLRPFFVAAFFKWIYDSLMFVGPQLLSALISYMEKDDDEDTWYGYAYAASMFVTAAVQTLFLQQYFHRVYRTGMRVRTVLVTTIYRKSLRLSPSGRQARTTGEVVNLMSTDSQRMQDLFPYLHVIWSSPYQIVLSLYFLWAELEYAVFVAVGIMAFIMMPATAVLAKYVKIVQKQVMAAKDARIKCTSECMTSMKVLKLYGWTQKFRDRVHEAREEELVVLRRYVMLRAAARTLWTATPVLVTLGTFGSYVWFGNDLDPATAFTALTLLNILRFPLVVLPNIFTSAIEAAVSLRRVGRFLTTPELEANEADQRMSSDLAPPHDPAHPPTSVAAVEVRRGNFFWDDDYKSPALKDVSLSLPRGALCGVVGGVGSGKSALVRALIGDLQKGPDAAVSVRGSVAYAAQEPWILNATLRENVLFGCAFDERWYGAVVEACALRSDFDILPAGDLTEIGERGINLSGGQKARVSLARAVYSKADVLYLESCFEAVDEHVGKAIWKKCIRGLLKKSGRTVVLVTHALKHLPEADVVVVMVGGSVAERGTYSELVQQGGEFARLLSNEEKQAAAEEQRAAAEAAKLAESGTSNAASGGGGGEKRESASNASNVSSVAAAGAVGAQPAAAVAAGEDGDGKTAAGKKAGENLTGSEERAVGKVSNQVYADYIKAFGGWGAAGSILVFLVTTTASNLGSSRWLAYWSDDTGQNPTSYYLGIYAALSFLNVGLITAAVVLLALYALDASRSMHLGLIHSVTRAPMAWFDQTPLGRILNRFGKDLYMVDEVLPNTAYSFLSTSIGVVGTVAIIAIVSPFFLVAIPPLSVGYFYVQRYYIASSRELKRWDSVLRSPIFSHFTETLDGVTSIRAYGQEGRFVATNQSRLDRSLQAYYLSIAANRWLAIRTETIGNFLVFFAAFFIVVKKGTIDASLAGLAVSYALQVTQALNWTVRMISDLETNIVSVERVNEYIATKPEAPLEAPEPARAPPSKWPTAGSLVFEDVRLRYRPDLELVLRGLDVKIEPREKVGVVGRTGAGKSSVFLLITRVVEPCGGRVLLDGVDTQRAGLQQLRSAIAVIPQDPVLFSGTVRHNLDPFLTHSDSELWAALTITQLEGAVRALEDGLGEEVAEGGANFSFGERQLFCIARAVLRRSPLLLMDEATSGIDPATDRLIQDTIRSEFKETTVLTIAHRIETIMDSDRVLVMDQGKAIEFDEPAALLKTEGSAFRSLAESMMAGKNGQQ